MEALHYLGIIQVFLLLPTSSNLDWPSTKVIFGAMDDRQNFWVPGTSGLQGMMEYQQFLQMVRSFDYVITHF